MSSPLRVDWCAGDEPLALHPLCGGAPVMWRCTRYVALHPLRGAAPVMWRCTRYVALHPNRRGVMPTDRVRCPSKQVKVWSVCVQRRLCRAEGRAASHFIHSPLFVSLVIHRGSLS